MNLAQAYLSTQSKLTEFEPHLSFTAFCALLIIRDKPEALRKISKQIGISVASMTGVRDRLEAEGLAQRGAITDRREYLLEITEKGLDVVSIVKPLPITDAEINEKTHDILGVWPSFEAQQWACKVVKLFVP